jgi:hypothetical protein
MSRLPGTQQKQCVEASTLSGGWAARRATWNFTRSMFMRLMMQIFEMHTMRRSIAADESALKQDSLRVQLRR